MINRVKQGDCRDIMKEMPDGIVQCVVTSPPYFGLRDYGLPPSDWQAVTFQPAPGLPEMTISAMSCCFGLEPTPWTFVGHMVEVFREVRRVLRDDGTVWLNLGDSYATKMNGPSMAPHAQTRLAHALRSKGLKEGLKNKDMTGIPWRVAFALQADGWYLRQDIIWAKPNPMPESVRDRCTKAHEYLFLLSKSAKYYFDNEAIKEQAKWLDNNPSGGSGVGFGYGYDFKKKPRVKIPAGWDIAPGSHGSFHKDGRGNQAYSFARKTATKGKPGAPNQHRDDRENVEYSMTRNKRSVWCVATYPYKGAHFATFPPKLIEPCILAGTREGDIVFDPFMGSGTTAEVCIEHGREFVGAELNPDYIEIQNRRIAEARRKAALPKQLELF